MTELEKISYAIGMNVGNNLVDAGMKEIDATMLAKAMKDAFAGKTEMNAAEAEAVMSSFFSKMAQEKSAAAIAEGKAFLEKNAKREGVTVLPSGLQYEVLTAAIGEKPKPTDKVKCHYHGTLINGQVFDSSVQRNQPATFGVMQVIKGWVEALQLMSVGAKWRLYIPYDLAYGDRGAGSIPPYSTLIFDVELLEIVK